MRNSSPVAITSEPRKYTIVSPSVNAAGWCIRTTPSPLKKLLSFIESVGYVSVS